MTVTDNNIESPDQIDEGSGISDMRRRIGSIGGKLEIALSPRFTLVAEIPDNEKADI